MMHQPISPGASDRPTRRQLAAAARIAMGFRTLYNQTQTITAVRSEGDPERHYWRRLLDYGVSGNLQTTLDEYGHVLRESLGLIDASADTIAACSILGAGLPVSTYGRRFGMSNGAGPRRGTRVRVDLRLCGLE
jgi:hypothetical protein